MATYGDLVEDARGIAGVARYQKTDRTVARLIWRGIMKSVRSAAELFPEDGRLPRSVVSVTPPADLTAGMNVPSNIKLLTVHCKRSDESRREVNMVSANDRWLSISPVPAAFVRNTLLYAVPAIYDAPWTHANIAAAGWSDVTEVILELVPSVAAPTSLADTTPFAVAPDIWEDVGVTYAVWRLTRMEVDRLAHDREMEALMIALSRGIADERVQEVV